jgi:tRNA threonylcarbamoyladenosine biosynthesis protein TsaE
MERTTTYSWESSSPTTTARLGEAIGRGIDRGMCVSLTGPLGAGKTVLTGGLCRGLGVGEEILSPTFVLYEEFDGRLPVVHIDLYRLEHEMELEELGVFDRLDGAAVVLAEWGDRSEALLSRCEVAIELRPGPGGGDTHRTIELTCTPETAPLFAGVEL